MVDHRLKTATLAHTSSVVALVDVLRTARGVEWESPPGAAHRIEHDFYRDETGETAVDAARLKVRAAVENSLETFTHATAQLERARASLEYALRPYVTRDVTQAPLTR